jgi:hypothetical protein
MARAVTVLVSTFFLCLCGLLMGWLFMKADMQTRPGREMSDAALTCFAIAPLAGALLGFCLSVVALKMFATPTR